MQEQVCYNNTKLWISRTVLFIMFVLNNKKHAWIRYKAIRKGRSSSVAS